MSKFIFYLQTIILLICIAYIFRENLTSYLSIIGQFISNNEKLLSNLFFTFIILLVSLILFRLQYLFEIRVETKTEKLIKSEIKNLAAEQQPSPLITLESDSSDPTKLKITNKGYSDVNIVVIFYKKTAFEIKKLKDFEDFILNREEYYNFVIEDLSKSEAYYSIIALYKSQLTGKHYLIGKNIHFKYGNFPIGISFNTCFSPMSVLEFDSINSIVKENTYSSKILDKIQDYLEKIYFINKI